MDYEEKWGLAWDKSTSPEVLEELSRDKDWVIRLYIVQNHSTPERGYAIRNKNLGEILQEMVKIRLEQEKTVELELFGI